MEKVEKVREFLEKHGIKTPQRIKTERGLKRYLKSQKANLEISVWILEARLRDKKEKLIAIMQALGQLEGDEE